MGNVGINIRFLRKKRKWSQAEIAVKLGISTFQTISDYETEKTEPSLDTLMKISDIFGISVDDMIKKNLYIEEQKGKLIWSGSRFEVGENGKLISKAKGKGMAHDQQYYQESDSNPPHVNEPDPGNAAKDETINALKQTVETLKLANSLLLQQKADLENKLHELRRQKGK